MGPEARDRTRPGANAQAVLARYRRLRAEAATHFAVCEAMAPYLAPSRTNLLRTIVPGEKQTRKLYDATALMGAELLAHFVASYTMNPSQVWGGLTVRGPEAPDAVQEWLEEVRDLILQDLAGSMFYGEMPEMLVDWAAFGTGCLVTDELPEGGQGAGWRGSYVEALRTGQFVIADGPDGLVDTLMYEKTMSAEQLWRRFGDAIPEEVRRAREQGERDKAFHVLHAIYPRDAAQRQGRVGALAMPWASCWVEVSSGQLLAESGYPIFPAVVPRYTRTPGEVFGRGRGHLAFPDAWTLNQSKRLSLEDLALKQRPPIFYAHDSVMGTLRLVPGGPVPVHTRGRPIQEVVHPYETGSRPEVANLQQEDLRKSIRQIFFVDQILMLMEVNKSEMTAFEFAKKMELLFRTLGPVYGRLRKEFMERLWVLKLTQLAEAKALPPPPPEILETSGEYEVVFENPLERAQRAGDLEATTLAVQDLLPLAQVHPGIWDWWDLDREAVHILRSRGVRAASIRSPEEVQARRQAAAAQEAQDLQLAQAGELATAAGKVAPLVSALQGRTR